MIRHLLVVDDLRHVARAKAPVLRRPAERQPALAREPTLEVAQELPAFLTALPEPADTADRTPVRRQLSAQKLADFAAKSLFFGREPELHGPSLNSDKYTQSVRSEERRV